MSTIRIAKPVEYGVSHYAIESDFDGYYAVPAWEEQGLGFLSGEWPTYGEAASVLVANQNYLEREGFQVVFD